MLEEIVDLEEIILAAARRWYEKIEQKTCEKGLKRKFPWESCRAVIDTSHLFVSTEHPDYELEEESKLKGGGNKSVVLFSTTYCNNTEDSELTYSLNTTRTTRSTCTLKLIKGFTCGRQFGIKLALPQNILELNAGFSSQLSIGNEKENSSEQELTWSIDTTITVPCHSQVRAELIIDERELNGKFKTRVSFSGKVCIVIYSKDNLELTRIIFRQLDTLFTSMHGFQVDPLTKMVYYDVEGLCYSRLGISQRVNVQQISLRDEDVTKS